jgi:cytoskeletal protein CcmA (bactofilin family)
LKLRFLQAPVDPVNNAKGSSIMKFRHKRSGQIRAVLGRGMTMTGELESTGTLRIDGNFHGSISGADNLIVGEHAVIHADIKVSEVEIHGRCFGTIEANRIEIFPGGRVHADIRTPLLCVSAGAMLQGGIQMADQKTADHAAATEEATDLTD